MTKTTKRKTRTEKPKTETKGNYILDSLVR